MSNEVFIPEINKNKSLFSYYKNIFNDDELLEINQWITKQNFKNGYWLNGRIIPRKQIWFQEKNKYFCEKWKYRYDRWESETYDDILYSIQNKIEQYTNRIISNYDWIKPININSCLINKYCDGNSSIKPHRDTPQSFGEYPIIAVFSIGTSRVMKIKECTKSDNSLNYDINLENNSLFIMGGYSQKYFTHEIPKCDTNLERHSFTFREYIY